MQGEDGNRCVVRSVGVGEVDKRQIENYLPHAIKTLAEGDVFGSMIKCKKHGAVFSLVDGRCIGNERIGNLKKYSASVIDGTIIIKL